jgi:hypothetical protein
VTRATDLTRGTPGRCARLIGLGVLALPGPACGPRERPLAVEGSAVVCPASHDRGGRCSDLGSLRACWETACPDGVCVETRPLPAGAPPVSGWRCSGQGTARRCESHSAHAGPFACDAETCVQHHARAPDNGEWECVDVSGVVYCRSTGSAAGIEPGKTDPAYLCGPRRGGRADERICVDFAPDAPTPDAAWSCAVRYQSGRAERVCRQSEEKRVGDACKLARDCPRGTTCASLHCLPARPEPACWFDTDCADGARCYFGSCAGSS